MKAIYFILFLAMTISCLSQTQPAIAGLTKSDYLQKSHSQKTWAWVLVGTGATTVIAGLASSAFEATANAFSNVVTGESTSGKSSSGGSVITIGGLTLIAGSIPLFIASSHNKNRAYSVGINNQSTYLPSGIRFREQNYPAISLKLNL